MHCSVWAVHEGMIDDSPGICMYLSNLFPKVPDNQPSF